MTLQHDEREEIALEGQGVRLLLPGGALLVHLPAADGVVILREAWSAQVEVPSTTVRIQYQDPAGGVLRSFQFETLQAFLAVLEPFATGGRQ